MTEAEWLACDNPQVLLDVVGDSVNKRKVRLFALAGCRRIENFLTSGEKHSRAAISVLERQIEGGASEHDLQSSLNAMTGEMFGHARNPGDAAGYALFAATDVLFRVRQGDWKEMAESVSAAIAYDALARSGSRDLGRIDTLWRRGGFSEIRWDEHEGMVKCLPEYLAALSVEQSNQAALLRDIFGNPFRPVAFAPEWRTDTAVTLARQMYESRDFSAMPILADALQDAGCDCDDVLNHCRNEGPHVRGCWVCDLVLGKE